MKKIDKILLANRGEIVERVLKTAQQMGIKVVVLFTEDDKDHKYLKTADVCVKLEGENLAETFLNKEKIIDIALANRVDAIHPGYGFLSENPEFARMCQLVGLTWIGPDPDVIELMGYKRSAREFVQKLGIPVLKARYGDARELSSFKDLLNFPVMVKALAGGGGKGMRIVKSADAYDEALAITAREAEMLFGDGSLYVEEFVEKARHIEVQVMGDNHGNVICLGERECTVQRRHQKLIEEAPAYGISEDLRKKLHNSALKIAKSSNYKSAGTVEFIVDENEKFHFLEMNTRIQVEHPVTEVVYGIDVVKEQLSVAAGSELSVSQEAVIRRGHALECRLYAEDPANGFMPQNGKLTLNAAPEIQSVRVDGSFERTAIMSPAYDPLIAKVIASGNDRLEAMKNMTRALNDYQIQGVKTNKGFLTNLLNSPVFIQNTIYTQYCDFYAHQHIDVENDAVVQHAVAWFLLNQHKNNGDASVWASLGDWKHHSFYSIIAGKTAFILSGYKTGNKFWNLSVNDTTLSCRITGLSDYELAFVMDDEPVKVVWSENDARSYFIGVNGENHLVKPFIQSKKRSAETELLHAKNVLSPLPGRVMRVYVSPGEKIAKGKALLVIESMKIENKIIADHDSVIKSVLVSEGQQLHGNDLMIELE